MLESLRRLKMDRVNGKLQLFQRLQKGRPEMWHRNGSYRHCEGCFLEELFSSLARDMSLGLVLRPTSARLFSDQSGLMGYDGCKHDGARLEVHQQ